MIAPGALVTLIANLGYLDAIDFGICIWTDHISWVFAWSIGEWDTDGDISCEYGWSLG
jgi:hypothetical protein